MAIATKQPAAAPSPATVAGRAQNAMRAGNAINALQETAAVLRIVEPKYEFGREPSPDHVPVFKCRVSFCGETWEATGPTKREAKHRAAAAWIEGMLDAE